MVRRLVSFSLCFLITAWATSPEDNLFLKSKAGEKGVKRLKSGLLYKVLTKGKGTISPTGDTICEVHYEGRLVSGTVFDSSYDKGEPLTVKPIQVIKGWKEALKLMVEGDEWELYVPSELGYGEKGSGEIPPDAALIFRVELLRVAKVGDANKKGIVVGEPGKNECPFGSERIHDEDGCRAAAASIQDAQFAQSGEYPTAPHGCYMIRNAGIVVLNSFSPGEGDDNVVLLCKKWKKKQKNQKAEL